MRIFAMFSRVVKAPIKFRANSGLNANPILLISPDTIEILVSVCQRVCILITIWFSHFVTEITSETFLKL